MINRIILKKEILFDRFLIVCFTSLALFLLIIAASPAYGITVTPVEHLFDISHNFSQPSDVSVSTDGNIYVVDGVNNSIKVFDSNGKYIFSFGKKGRKAGEFNLPLGLDIDSSGYIYIADSGNSRVQMFSSEGRYISSIMIPPVDGILADPTDVAVDESKGVFYVVDNNNHNIRVYDMNTLQPVKTYGSPGIGKREFRYPFFMTLNTEGYLHVVDVINTRVQILNPEGLFVENIGGWGVKKGEFFRPKGVATDNDNLIYVSDSYLGVIQVFKQDGVFHSVIGEEGKAKVKKFTSPVGIFIDSNNRLYVVEMFGEKVSVYKLINKTKGNSSN